MGVSFAEQALDVKKKSTQQSEVNRYGIKISTYPWIISLFGFQIEHPYDNMHMGVEKIPSTCL